MRLPSSYTLLQKFIDSLSTQERRGGKVHKVRIPQHTFTPLIDIISSRTFTLKRRKVGKEQLLSKVKTQQKKERHALFVRCHQDIKKTNNLPLSTLDDDHNSNHQRSQPIRVYLAPLEKQKHENDERWCLSQ